MDSIAAGIEIWQEMEYDEMTSRILFFVGIYGCVMVFFLITSMLIYIIRKRFEKKPSQVPGARVTKPVSTQEIVVAGVVMFFLIPLLISCFGMIIGSYLTNWWIMSVSVVGATVFGSFTSISAVVIVGMICLTIQQEATSRKRTILHQ